MITIPKRIEKATKTGNLTGLKPFALLYRNKWDSVNNVFALESTPIDISEMIVKPNTLSMTLDVNEIAQYNANNVTLTLSDPQNKFIEGVPGSYFPEGYQLYGSKVVLYYGFEKPEISQTGYTLVGTPTLINGVASNFTRSNYVETTENNPFNSAETWEAGGKFTLGENISSVCTVIGCDYNGYFNLGLNNAKKPRLMVGETSSSFFATILADEALEEGGTYWIKGTYDGTTYRLFISTDGKDYSLVGSAVSNKKVGNSNKHLAFGVGFNAKIPLKGSIDLNDTYIKINGNMWFSGAALFNAIPVTPIFIGVIKDLPTHKPNKYQVDLKLVSPLELLKDIEARDFSNKVTGETLTLDHIGDNNEEYYITANEGVGGITALYANGVKLYEGVDYNVSDLNNLALPAMIEVVNGSVFGQTFTADYYYWKRALAIEDIIRGLVALGGYDASTEDIQPVVWQNEVRNPPTISPVLAALGYYEDEANEYKFLWEGSSNSWDFNIIKGGQNRRNILPDNFDYSFLFRMETTTLETGKGAISLGDEYNATDIYYDSANIGECGVTNGISVRWVKDAIRARVFIYQISNGTPTLLYEAQLNDYRNPNARMEIQRRGSAITIYKDGTQVATATYNGSMNYQRYFYNGNSYTSARNQSFNIYNSNMYLVGENLGRPCIVTETLDKTLAGITWGAVQADLGELDGQTYFLTAYFSNDGLTWSAGTNYNLDTDTAQQERYMYYILGISNAPGMSFDITDPRTYFYATNLVLNMVNLGNSSVLEALQDLSLISGYEFGVDRNGIFFFRPRENSTTPIYELDHSELVSVETVKKNINDFFTKLTLTFAQVPLEFYANEGTRPTPIDRYGVINKDIDKPEIVNYDNPELAQAIGPQMLSIYSTLRDNLQAVGKLNLALELGDIVNLKRNYPLTADENSTDFDKFTRQDTYYRACKITGLNYNFSKRQITYTLQDVSDSNNKPEERKFWEFVYDFPIELGAK